MYWDTVKLAKTEGTNICRHQSTYKITQKKRRDHV